VRSRGILCTHDHVSRYLVVRTPKQHIEDPNGANTWSPRWRKNDMSFGAASHDPVAAPHDQAHPTRPNTNPTVISRPTPSEIHPPSSCLTLACTPPPSPNPKLARMKTLAYPKCPQRARERPWGNPESSFLRFLHRPWLDLLHASRDASELLRGLHAASSLILSISRLTPRVRNLVRRLQFKPTQEP
jgi:hypothetical protein